MSENWVYFLKTEKLQLSSIELSYALIKHYSDLRILLVWKNWYLYILPWPSLLLYK